MANKINQINLNSTIYDVEVKGENVNGTVAEATTAAQLASNAGSATQPVYFSGGKPVACTYTLGASVPAGAKFTDTTYSAATQSAVGLMSAADKVKLDGITASADSVSFTRNLTSGTKIGTITINGSATDLYCQTNTDTDTHWTTRIYAGASGTAANAAATNPYIKITDNNAYRNQIRLVGGGATTVTSDASGNITIKSTDTNTTYSVSTLHPTSFTSPSYVFTMGASGYSGGGGYSTLAQLRTAMGIAAGATNFTCTYGGTSPNCYYKFSDGTLICVKNVATTAAITTAWASGWYESAAISLGNWPYTFKANPWVSAMVEDGGWAILEAVNGATTTSAGKTYLARPSSTASKTYYIDVIAIGRWA